MLSLGTMWVQQRRKRLAQEPLGSNFSPAIGMDISGPTAAVKSVTKPDLLLYAIRRTVDLQINPGRNLR